MRQESEFYSRLKAQRDELMEQNQLTRTQIKGIDNLKLNQLNKDQEYVRGLLASIDERVSEEVEKRLRSEFAGKQSIEEKLQFFRDEIRNDEKQMLQGEQRLARGVHESITSLNQIMKNTKEQLEAQASASQAVVAENLKALSKSIESVRETTQMRVQLVEHAQVELNGRVSETRQMLHDHHKLVTDTMQQELSAQEERRILFERDAQAQIEEYRALFAELSKSNDDWRVLFEQKNLQVLNEISGALKVMKGEIKAQVRTTTASITLIQTEFKDFRTSQDGLFHNLEDHMYQVQKQLTFKCDEALGLLSQQLDNMKVQTQLDIDSGCEAMYEECKTWTTKHTGEVQQQILQDFGAAQLKQDLELKQGTIEAEIRVRDHVTDREKSILAKLDEVVKEEIEQRNQLTKLMYEYQSTMQTFREEMRKEFKLLTNTMELQATMAIDKLTTEVREKNSELSRQLQTDILAADVRVNKRVDEVVLTQTQQYESVKEMIERVESALKSHVLQQVEQMKFEVRSQLKDMDNQVFKMKVWLMKQVELINHAMQDLHLHIQSEAFMERMYIATTMEQLQNSIESRLNWEHQIAVQYQ